MQFKIDHIGVAVADVEQGLADYAALFGYELLRGPYDDPLQQARVAFIGRPGAAEPPIELVAPLGPDSQVHRILAKGMSLYHICYETPNIEEAIAHLRRQKCLLVSGPTPAVAYDGRPIAWLYMPNRQLTELVEAPAARSGGGAP